MATGEGCNYHELQPGSHFDDDQQEGVDAPPPAFNPDVIQPKSSAISYGTIPQDNVPCAPPAQPINPELIPHSEQIQYGYPYVQQQQQPQSQPIIIVPAHAARPDSALIPPSCPPAPRRVVVYSYKNPSGSHKCRRFIALIGGIIACCLMIAAMSSNELAKGHYDDGRSDCTMFYLDIKGDDDLNHWLNDDDDDENHRAVYGEYCLNEEHSHWKVADSWKWCDTFRAATCWVVAVSFGLLLSCMGSCWVSPICVLGRCCCPSGCPRILFVLALLVLIFGNVMWFTNDEVCHGVFGMDIGYSIELVSAACVSVFCAAVCAK